MNRVGKLNLYLLNCASMVIWKIFFSALFHNKSFHYQRTENLVAYTHTHKKKTSDTQTVFVGLNVT